MSRRSLTAVQARLRARISQGATLCREAGGYRLYYRGRVEAVDARSVSALLMKDYLDFDRLSKTYRLRTPSIYYTANEPPTEEIE